MNNITLSRQAESMPIPQLAAYYARFTQHKLWVFWYVIKICMALVKRGLKHDMSKCLPVEIGDYIQWTEATRGLEYGTPEYWAVTVPFIGTTHFKLNSHHPEHYPNGVRDMSPLDIIEMLADWRAASRRKGGDMQKSIELNAVHYQIEAGFKLGIQRDVKEVGL